MATLDAASRQQRIRRTTTAVWRGGTSRQVGVGPYSQRPSPPPLRFGWRKRPPRGEQSTLEPPPADASAAPYRRLPHADDVIVFRIMAQRTGLFEIG